MRRFGVLLSAMMFLSVTAEVHAEWLDPPRPLTKEEREATAPSPDLPIAEYRPLYCQSWTDGCTVCERDPANLRGEPKCKTSEEASCKPGQNVCTALTADHWRTCTYMHDGCNESMLYGSTAMYCPKHNPKYTCMKPRGRNNLTDEVNATGTWRLSDNTGRRCELSLGAVSDTGSDEIDADCYAMIPELRNLSRIRAKGDRIFMRLKDKNEGWEDGKVIVSFKGITTEHYAAQYRGLSLTLERLDPYPFDRSSYSGVWAVSVGNDKDAVCSLFLGVNNMAESDAVKALGHNPVAYDSNCKLPWTTWGIDQKALVLKERGGKIVRLLPRRVEVQHRGESERPLNPQIELAGEFGPPGAVKAIRMRRLFYSKRGYDDSSWQSIFATPDSPQPLWLRR